MKTQIMAIADKVAIRGQFTVRLRSVGNPDYGQYTAISEPEVLVCASARECLEGAMRYRDEWELGGGNWHGIFIVRDGVKLAEISYNGRLWSVTDSRKELFVEDLL